MSVITYAAVRGFVDGGLSVVGTDISASAADNSFNATSTDLSGLLAGYWALLSGFAAAENNGWHQLTIDSVSGKITTSSTLVTESAGASISIDGYMHGMDQEYSLEFDVDMGGLNPFRKRVLKKKHMTANGQPYGRLLRVDGGWNVVTEALPETETPYWSEFYDSVSACELFTFDALGTIAVPVDPVTVYMESDSWSPPRVGLDQFVYSFTLRRVNA